LTDDGLNINQLVKNYIHSVDAIKALPDFLCPSIVGNRDVKLGTLCMLASGDDNESRNRIHLLFGGLPGTGKTVLMNYLSKQWDAQYITSSPTGATLKGDARRKNSGEMVMHNNDGGIVAIDELESMPNPDLLRDVMESGYYDIAAGGTCVRYDARCRIIGGTNNVSKLSNPMQDRFDLIYHLDVPSGQESLEIATRIFCGSTDLSIVSLLLQNIMAVVNDFNPGNPSKEIVTEEFSKFFKNKNEGETGRWLQSVRRIARALARLQLHDVTREDIRMAIRMKLKSERRAPDNYIPNSSGTLKASTATKQKIREKDPKATKLIKLNELLLSQNYSIPIDEISEICKNDKDFRELLKNTPDRNISQNEIIVSMKRSVLNSKPNIIPNTMSGGIVRDENSLSAITKPEVRRNPVVSVQNMIKCQKESEEQPEHQYQIEDGLKLYYTCKSLDGAQKFYAGLLKTTPEYAINMHHESDDPDYDEMICFDLTWREKLGGYNAAGGRITPSKAIAEANKLFQKKDVRMVALTSEIL